LCTNKISIKVKNSYISQKWWGQLDKNDKSN
jgi:hypothetical protein